MPGEAIVVYKLACAYQRYTLPIYGYLCMNSRFVFFVETYNNNNSIDFLLDWKNVIDVSKSSFLLCKSAIQLKSNAIGQQLENGSNTCQTMTQYLFHSFESCTSALTIIMHCWTMAQHTPSYKLYYKYGLKETMITINNNNNNNREERKNTRSEEEDRNRLLGNQSINNNNNNNEAVEDRILRKALYAMNRAHCSIQSLERQEEKLTASENDLNDMKYNLQISDRNLRGINSLTGTIYNFFTVYKEPNMPEQKVYKTKNIVLSFENSFPICFKNMNNKFENDMLIFTSKTIDVVHGMDKSLIVTIPIASILELRYETSEYHFQIIFQSKNEPLSSIELISLFSPLLIKRILERKKDTILKPIVEYGKELEIILQKCIELNNLMDKEPDPSHSLIEHVREVKKNERYEKLDTILSVLDNLEFASGIISSKLDDSNNQLARIDKNVDDRQKHIEKNTRKINRLLN